MTLFFFLYKVKTAVGFIARATAVLRFDSQLGDAYSCPDTANEPPAAKGRRASHLLLFLSPGLVGETETNVDRAQHPLDVHFNGVITLNTCC